MLGIPGAGPDADSQARHETVVVGVQREALHLWGMRLGDADECKDFLTLRAAGVRYVKHFIHCFEFHAHNTDEFDLDDVVAGSAVDGPQRKLRVADAVSPWPDPAVEGDGQARARARALLIFIRRGFHRVPRLGRSVLAPKSLDSLECSIAPTRRYYQVPGRCCPAPPTPEDY